MLPTSRSADVRTHTLADSMREAWSASIGAGLRPIRATYFS
ncbi:hypothetical protein MycrhDRAFT_4817 [Mycolicibacterium rhodesiae JS60]|nr:hypothetical protein MycrhDRAFT_4817 [Mycolicibacterium rhodesiae JS60]